MRCDVCWGGPGWGGGLCVLVVLLSVVLEILLYDVFEAWDSCALVHVGNGLNCHLP